MVNCFVLFFKCKCNFWLFVETKPSFLAPLGSKKYLLYLARHHHNRAVHQPRPRAILGGDPPDIASTLRSRIPPYSSLVLTLRFPLHEFQL